VEAVPTATVPVVRAQQQVPAAPVPVVRVRQRVQAVPVPQQVPVAPARVPVLVRVPRGAAGTVLLPA
jgi:hypothetical protein